MLALISPAKKQDFSPNTTNLSHSQPLFGKQTQELMATLRNMHEDGLIELMKVSPKLAKLNVQRFKAFSKAHSIESARQAALAFQGDTYVGLDAQSMSLEDWSFANDHLAILSGLYGFLRPLDLIQAHRLEMGTRLETSHGKNLYTFWADAPTKQINIATQSQNSPWVINLASQEYFKVVRQELLHAPLLTPVFKENRDGQLKVIGIKAKKARGMMARFIIKNRLLEPEKLKTFNAGGYHFRNDLSNEQEWVFVAG
jgi:uncharacterized protein